MKMYLQIVYWSSVSVEKKKKTVAEKYLYFSEGYAIVGHDSDTNLIEAV